MERFRRGWPVMRFLPYNLVKTMRPDYLNIPIRDCGEPLQEIPESAFPRVAPHPYLAVGAPYTGSPWRLRSGALSALYRAQSLLSGRRPGWRIALFDAYRPLAVQRFMVWDAFRREAQAMGCLTRLSSCAGPDALERLDPEIHTLLAPKVYRFWGIPDPDPCRPPPHSTGAAIDCKLVDGEGRDVPMGGPVDDFTDRAIPNFYASALPGTPEYLHHRNRELLVSVMTQAGFAQHVGEWWHFSIGDQMWAHAVGATHALYGRIPFAAIGAPAPTG